MKHITFTPQPTPSFSLDISPLSYVSSAFRTLTHWSEKARQRHKLSQLDERLLNDIGIPREQVMQEVAKPFWD